MVYEKDEDWIWDYVQRSLNYLLKEHGFLKHIKDIKIQRSTIGWYEGQIIFKDIDHPFELSVEVVPHKISGTPPSIRYWISDRHAKFDGSTSGYNKFKKYIKDLKETKSMQPLGADFPNVWGVDSVRQSNIDEF